MDAIGILKRYFKTDSELFDIVYTHSRSVADKALSIVKNHAELDVDPVFIEEASLVHDIGVFMTNVPSIYCFGTYPYICHGYLGRDIIEKEGFPKHGLVCERHIGTGLSLEEICVRKLPLPRRDMTPKSWEEKIICFSDLFFSKTNLDDTRSVENVRKGLKKYGFGGVERFDEWCNIFL